MSIGRRICRLSDTVRGRSSQLCPNVVDTTGSRPDSGEMRVGGRAVLVVLLAATLASGFSTVLAHQAVRASGGETATWRLAVLNTSFWYGWALLALPLGLLSKRLRIDRSPRLAVPIHIVAVLTAAAAHLAIQTTAQVGVLWHSLAL